jgi:hypothetical protein
VPALLCNIGRKNLLGGVIDWNVGQIGKLERRVGTKDLKRRETRPLDFA